MDLGRRLAARLGQATLEKAQAEIENAAVNRPLIHRSVLELTKTPLGAGDSAVVVCAGPSLHQRKSLERLKAAGYAGTIVTTDGSLGACLRAGVVPHVVVSADPDLVRIVRWFGDPTLTEAPADDYFRRQEMDPVCAADEVGANRVLIELVDRHGPKIKAALATWAGPNVVDRCQKAGMALYWWNAMVDDYEKPGSASRRLWEANGMPCLNGGGNVGTAAWVLTHAVLGKKRVALVGMDLGYPPGLPYSRTQLYPELREMLGDRYEEAFISVKNPDSGETWFTDPRYYWLREVFLEMVNDAKCQTYNCTEGGTLFGPGIKTVPLDEFLKIVGKDGDHG